MGTNPIYYFSKTVGANATTAPTPTTTLCNAHATIYTAKVHDLHLHANSCWVLGDDYYQGLFRISKQGVQQFGFLC